MSDDPVNVDLLERVTQKLVPPPFVPDHDQIASGAPKVVQVRLVVEEKAMVIDDDGTEIADTEYWLVDRNSGPPYYGIRLKSASTYAWEFDQDCWVSVAGSWGWSSVPPEDVVQACIRWAAYTYHQKAAPVYETTAFPESGVITTPVGIPVDVKLMLRPYVKGF